MPGATRRSASRIWSDRSTFPGTSARRPERITSPCPCSNSASRPAIRLPVMVWSESTYERCGDVGSPMGASNTTTGIPSERACCKATLIEKRLLGSTTSPQAPPSTASFARSIWVCTSVSRLGPFQYVASPVERPPSVNPRRRDSHWGIHCLTGNDHDVVAHRVLPAARNAKHRDPRHHHHCSPTGHAVCNPLKKSERKQQ